LRQRGIDNVILYRHTDFADAVRRMTGKRGVDVIIDHVGVDTWEGNIRCLTKGGRLVICGSSSGYMAPTNLRFLFFKNLSLLGSTMGSKAALLRILALVETQKLRPWIHSVVPMEDIQDAHAVLEARQVTGKVGVCID
jgi:NADPH:quinone reductase-like Zn-dependent oxidoreductase